MKTTVLITLLNDKRVFRTLKSLEEQSRKPDYIFIADGGSEEKFLNKIKKYATSHKNIMLKVLKGTISQTRNSALNKLPQDTDIIVFLDSDEVAPENWLETLIKPIETDEADFTGGPTKPYSTEKNEAERFLNKYYEYAHKNVASTDAVFIAMGNSAWKSEIFSTIGNFISSDRRVSEDFDINIRAVKQGFQGKYVKKAWVYHDMSHINNLWKLLKRSYRLDVGTTVTYLKNKSTFSRFTKSTSRIPIFHPYQILIYLIKPIALIIGCLEWRRYHQ